MAKKAFQFIIIHEPDGSATPKLVSSNGKVALNERCKNAADIHTTWNRVRDWIKNDKTMDSMPTEMMRAAWDKKFPHGPVRNSGPKKKPTVRGGTNSNMDLFSAGIKKALKSAKKKK